MTGRSAVVLALCVGACAAPARMHAPAASEPFVLTSPLDVESLGRTVPVYRSGSRLKIRWIGPPAGGVAMIPIGIYDSKLEVDCELTGGDTPSCIPVAEVVDDEKLAFSDADRNEPALIVDDSECVTPAAHTKDDDHLWSLSPFADFDLQSWLDESRIPPRYTLEPAARIEHPWTNEGPGCVVHVRQDARGPVCARKLRPADLSDVVHGQASVLGSGKGEHGLVNGTIVIVGTDGSMLEPPGGPSFYDAHNELRCALDREHDTCLPAAWDRLEASPVVGREVADTNYSGRFGEWGNRAEGGTTIWAKLSAANANGGNTQNRMVLALLDPHTVVPVPLGVDGRERIAVHVRVMPDGRRVPVSLYDTKFDRDCEPKKTAAGDWRCTVGLPYNCHEETYTESGIQKTALLPAPGMCKPGESCCTGGPVFFAAVPARPPRRFGMDASMARPGVPEHAARFSTTPHDGTHVRGYFENIAMPVYDKIEDLPTTAFAELRVVQDH